MFDVYLYSIPVIAMSMGEIFSALKSWFVKRLREFEVFSRIAAYSYGVSFDMSLGEVLDLVSYNNKMVLHFILAEQRNFLLTCEFLVLFPELKDEDIYKNALSYVLLSQRRNGLWMIEPDAIHGDGDVRSDLITEPTIYGAATMYANRENDECMEAFRIAWKKISMYPGFWGHGYDALGTTLGAIRVLDKAGVLRSEFAKCERLYDIRDACLRNIEGLIEEFTEGSPEIMWGVSFDSYMEILYRLGHDRSYLARKLEEFKEVIARLPDNIRKNPELAMKMETTWSEILLEGVLTYDVVRRLYYDVVWLPLDEMEIRKPRDILKIIDFYCSYEDDKKPLKVRCLFMTYALIKRICGESPRYCARLIKSIRG